nr:g-type lectin s-receptor-like serine/threonine-protein kinase rks1 [Quercus suber]
MFKPLILIILFIKFCTSLDTLTTNQPIKDGQSLISKNKKFALGFFSPGNSSFKYLGIWYVATPKTVVWVANRNDPINDSSGVLSINQYGELVLHDSNSPPLWSTNISVQDQVTTSLEALLLDSGNLVLVQDNNKKVLWQSFDHPTDTLLPNMKLGLNLKTRINTFLTSWKSKDDPGTGNYCYKMNLNGSPQVFLYNGSTPYWKASLNVSFATSSSGQKFFFVNNQDEISSYYSDDDPSTMTRLVLDNTGLLQKLMWDDGVHQWKEQWSTPKYQCDKYGHCGSYGKCNPDNINRFECMCLPGYEPKSPRDWYLRDGSKGCVRKNSGLSMCKNGEGFVKLEHLVLPDSSIDAALIGTSMSSSECELACLTNCSCTAFTSMNTDGKGTGCLAWYGELIDILQLTDLGSELNVRVDATELAKYIRKSKRSLSKKRKLAIALVSIAVPMFLVSLLAYIWLMKKKKTKDFGMARIFKEGQTQDKTNRVVGTYGYMSPEYAVFGKFSTKSDVFSLGVILLEIVSGKKNSDSYQEHPSLTLIGHVSTYDSMSGVAKPTQLTISSKVAETVMASANESQA